MRQRAGCSVGRRGVGWERVPKPRHDNPHAERQIEALDLPCWQSAAEVEAAERQAAALERQRVELRKVDWESLSPAELAFRWFLDRRESDGRYRRWAHEVLEAWKTRQNEVATATCAPR
jgi:hypothetical protein